MQSKFFDYIFLKDVGSKDVQQREKHFRDQESIVSRNVYEVLKRNSPIFVQYSVYVNISKFDQKKQ